MLGPNQYQARDYDTLVDSPIVAGSDLALHQFTVGGGLEHRNSTVLMASRWDQGKRSSYVDWLSLASHEYFHLRFASLVLRHFPRRPGAVGVHRAGELRAVSE
jgi:predicted metalloprotease with PDZ domain